MIRWIDRLPGLVMILLLLSACASDSGSDLDPEQRAETCAAALAGKPLGDGAPVHGQPPPAWNRDSYPPPADLGIALRPGDREARSLEGKHTAASGRGVDDYVLQVLSLTAEPFDWNRADSEVLCAAIETGSPHIRLTIEPTLDPDAVLGELAQVLGEEPDVRWRDDRFGSVCIVAPPCSRLEALRSLPGICSVELDRPLDLTALMGRTSSKSAPSRTVAGEGELDPFNPGLYDPATDGPYVEYIRERSPFDADIMERHRLAEVFELYGVPIHPAIGIAVLDNGVLPEWVDDYSTGFGDFRFEGHHRNGRTGRLDGPHPLETDFFGLSAVIPGSFNHGTRQLGHVQRFAPHATRASKRSSSLVFLLLEEDFQGVLEAIAAVAEDPDLHVISMSMGTLFHSKAIESAIAYLNRKGKILVSAAGTFPDSVVKDLLPVIFPASLPGTVSVTGIKDPRETGGEFVLGDSSFSGPENDFVTDSSPSSSEAASTMAATLATLWALEPSRTREEVLAALVASSNFFQERRGKHPVFGWGKVDALRAARIVLGEEPLPEELKVCEGIRR